MPEFKIFGVVASALTPFTPTGEPDFDLFEKHVAALDRAGVNGM